MKLLTLAAACAAVVTLSAAPAFAADPVVAKLAQPVPQATKFIAGEAVFNCEGDTCVAAAPQSQTFSTADLQGHRRQGRRRDLLHRPEGHGRHAPRPPATPSPWPRAAGGPQMAKQ